MGKLIKPLPLPSIYESRFTRTGREGLEGDPPRHQLLFGRELTPRCGEFIARLYDARARFSPTTNSKRWRLSYPKDEFGRPVRIGGVIDAVREYGYWKDDGDPLAPQIGEGEEHLRVPFGTQSGNYRDINVQFQQMNNVTQTVGVPKPPNLITSPTPLGDQELSVIQAKVVTGAADGFYPGPPQSHYMDPDPTSPTFGDWIEPEKANVITPTNNPSYWQAAATLRTRLKHGVSHLHLWCPSGEYREFDTLDKEHFKVTELPFYQAEEKSLVIKTGYEASTQWDVYLMPQRVRIQMHWVDYYWAATQFTLFQLGFHTVRNLLTRLPVWPVAYGQVGGEFANILGVDDWVYYLARWHGPLAPGPANLHPRPVGFAAAGGEDNFNPALLTGGIWEGNPAHGTDYGIEYAIKHEQLLKHNPLDQQVVTVFFAIIYSYSSPVGYYARLQAQNEGDLCAVVKAKGTGWKENGPKFYIWQRTPKTTLERTINEGTMLHDWLAGSDFWSLDAALQLGGWA